MEENLGLSTSPSINSVLKPPKPRIPLQDIMAAVHDEENTADRKRRVSFANVNKVKEFSSGAESMVVCQTPAYEEPFYVSSDSSCPSGAEGWTPAINMSVSADAGNIQAFIHSEQKKQFLPLLNPDNSGNVDHNTDKLSFQNHWRQSLPNRTVSRLFTQDNNTVFATSCNSLNAMDLTKCIDNRQSMGMNSTKFSVGMDLTECIKNPQNATSNATRFSLGMDMTNVVGKSMNAMSLSSEGMDFTKAVIGNAKDYTDQRSPKSASCLNFSVGVSLDDSNALELTDAINDPRFSAMSMLYSVSSAGLNKNGQHSVPDKTRYSLSGMDLTKAAISNCSSARRKSTRYSLNNMDLTEVVKAGDCSGLEFTEVINDPKIVAMSTRYSINDTDLTEGLVSKNHMRFSISSTENAETVEDKLDYSAGSEASMDFTRPIHNILEYHEQTDSLLNDCSMVSNHGALTAETEGRKSSRSSVVHIDSQDINVNKEFIKSPSKINTFETTDHTLNCLGKAESSMSLQNGNLTSDTNLLQLNCNNSKVLHSPMFQPQLINENVCAADTTTKQISPQANDFQNVLDKSVTDSSEKRDELLSLACSNNSSFKIDLPSSSSSKDKTGEDGGFIESMQSENQVTSNEVSTSCSKLQECKATNSEKKIDSDEHLEVAEISYEDMEVSDIDSCQIVETNYDSRKGSNSPTFSKEFSPKPAEESSKSKLLSVENQPRNVSTVTFENMEIDTIDLNSSPDLSVLELSQSHEHSDCAPLGRNNLHTAADKELAKPNTSEEHSQSSTSVSSVINNSQFKDNKCIGNNVEREPSNVEVNQIRSSYDGATSLQTEDFSRDSIVEGGNIELEKNSNCSLSKGLPTSEISTTEEKIDNSLNSSEDYRMGNISVDESLKLQIKSAEDNNTLFMSNYEKNETSKSLQQSHVEDTAAVDLHISSDSLANGSTNETLCGKNITITRGGATRHSTMFSMLHSLSEMSKNEDSLTDDNAVQTSVLESLPLIQRIAMSEDTTQNSSEVQQEKKETKTQKGGKRSFEEALQPENDTKESPLKQLCLSKGDCDLLINVTAPSFLMDTMCTANETSKVSDTTLKTIRAVSPTKNQTLVEPTVNRKGVFTNIELTETSMSFKQKRNVDDVCDNSFSLVLDISTDHDTSRIGVHKDERKNINVEIKEHIKRTPGTSDYLTEQTITTKVENKSGSSSQCMTVPKSCSPQESPIRFEPSCSVNKSKSKSVGNALELRNKHKELTSSGVGNEEYLRLRHSMALFKVTSLTQPKDMDIFSKNKKIRNLGGGLFVCDIIPKWIEFHFVADLSGNLTNPSYKIVCLERERAVGEYMLQQVKACLPPQNASDLLTQLQSPVNTALAELARSLNLICKYHNGQLKGNILKIELMNCKKHFWIFVDINIKYPHNLTMTDITISKQKIGDFKLVYIRQIFDSINKSPKQLIRFASELTKLQWE